MLPFSNKNNGLIVSLMYLKVTTDSPSICLFRVNNRNTRKKYEICSKLPINKPERRQWCSSGVLIVTTEDISDLFLVFLLLTLNK